MYRNRAQFGPAIRIRAECSTDRARWQRLAYMINFMCARKGYQIRRDACFYDQEIEYHECRVRVERRTSLLQYASGRIACSNDEVGTSPSDCRIAI